MLLVVQNKLLIRPTVVFTSLISHHLALLYILFEQTMNIIES